MKRLLDNSTEELKKREFEARKEDNKKAITYITEDWENDKISVDWERFYEEHFNNIIYLNKTDLAKAKRLHEALEDLLVEAEYFTLSKNSYCFNVDGKITGSEKGWDFVDLDEAEKFMNAKYNGTKYFVEVIQKTGRYKKNE